MSTTKKVVGCYNPNCAISDRMEVEVTFGAWDYRKTLKAVVGGNCRGLDIINCAIGSICDDLPSYPNNDEDGVAIIVLENEDGGTLECEDEEGRGEDWLKEMVISARIISLNGESL